MWWYFAVNNHTNKYSYIIYYVDFVMNSVAYLYYDRQHHLARKSHIYLNGAALFLQSSLNKRYQIFKFLLIKNTDLEVFVSLLISESEINKLIHLSGELDS